MNKKPLIDPLTDGQAAMFVFKLYLPALRRYIRSGRGIFNYDAPDSSRKIEQINSFFNRPGNATAKAVFRATPYYRYPGMLLSQL